MPDKSGFLRALVTLVRPLLLLALMAASAATQTNQKPDVWAPLKFFVGAWEGTSKGQPGQGTCEREYQFAFNGKFLQVKNKSTTRRKRRTPKAKCMRIGAS
jgi:hypothetical protein